MIDNVKEDNPSEDPQEDKELINYLEDSSEFDKLDIDDEYIYHPDNNKADVVNLEDAPIDKDFLINTPKEEKLVPANKPAKVEPTLEELKAKFLGKKHKK